MADQGEIYRRFAAGEIDRAQMQRELDAARGAPAAKPQAEQVVAEPLPDRPGPEKATRQDAAALERTVRKTEQAAERQEEAKQGALGQIPEVVQTAGDEARVDVREKFPTREAGAPEGLGEMATRAFGPRYQGDSPITPNIADEGQGTATTWGQGLLGTAGALWHGASRFGADLFKAGVETVTPLRFEEPSREDPEGDRVRLMKMFEGVDVGRYAGDALGHAIEPVTAPVYRSPTAVDVAPFVPKGAAEGAALVPVETSVGAGMRIAGSADEAALVEALRRPMEWTGLLPERENAWRAKAPWGLGYVADVLQTVNTGEGFGDIATQHADYVRPTIERIGGEALADWYKSNARSLGRAADFFLPFGSVYAAAGRAATTPIRARDLAHATGVDLKTATTAVAGEDLPSWITTAKITDVGDAVGKRVQEQLDAGNLDLPPRLRADMEDMIARDRDYTVDTEGGHDVGDAVMEAPEAATLADMLTQAGTSSAMRVQIADLASEAAKRRARASLGDDLVVTMAGPDGEPLVISAKEYDSVLGDVTARAKALGFNAADIAGGKLTPPQRALLYGELRRHGYDGPLPHETPIEPTYHREGVAGEGDEAGMAKPGPTPQWGGRRAFDAMEREAAPGFDRLAYNALVDRWVASAAGRAAQQRYAVRAYSPVASWLGRKLRGTDQPLKMPSWVTSLSRITSPNPATADVPLPLRVALEHHLRQGEQIATGVRDQIVEAGQSGGGLEVMFSRGLIDDVPNAAYLDRLKTERGVVKADIAQRAEAAAEEAALKEAEKEHKKALVEELAKEDQRFRQEYNRARSNLSAKRREFERDRASGREGKEATLKGATAALEAARADAAKRLAQEARDASKSFDEDQSVVDLRGALTREGQAAERAEATVLEILVNNLKNVDLIEEAARVMAANTRQRRFRTKEAPAGQPNPVMKNGYRLERIEHEDGTVTETVHPPDATLAVKAKIAMRSKLLKALGEQNPDLAAFKTAWREFAHASSKHQRYQREFNEARTTLRNKLSRVNTSVADLRNPDFERVDPSTLKRPEAQALVQEAKDAIAAELQAKALAEADGPPPPLPLDHPAVAKASEVKAAQRDVDRAKRALDEHDANLAKQREDIDAAEARLEAARVALDRHKAAVSARLAQEELERMQREGGVPVDKIEEVAQDVGQSDPQIRIMLDEAVRERVGDEPMTPEKRSHLHLQVLNEMIAEQQRRTQEIARQIEGAFAPAAKRTHGTDPMEIEHAEELVKALLRVPEDEGASLTSQLKTRYGPDALDDVAGGLFRMAVDRALDYWLGDVGDWMLSVGLAVPIRELDQRFVKAIHNAMAGKGDVVLSDGRFTSVDPDQYKQAAASFLTRWGLSEMAARGSDPLGDVGRTGLATAQPIARAIEAARNRAKMPSWAWSETREFGDTSKRGAIGEATGRALTTWKTGKVIGYTGMRAPAFILGNVITMPFIMDASLGQRATYRAFGQYARHPGFMAAVLDMHTTPPTVRGRRWEDPSYQGRYITTATGKVISASEVASILHEYQIESSQPHVEFARDMYDDVLDALDRPTQIGPLGKLLKGFGVHGAAADAAARLEIKAKGAGREVGKYHEMIWEIVRAVDSTARVAAVVDALEQGLSRDQAASHGREAALDYGKLNSTERFVIRRMVPFYAFQRRMFAAYAKNPSAFARHARMQNTWEADYGGDDERGYDPNPGRLTLARFGMPGGSDTIFDTPTTPHAGLIEMAMAMAGVARSIATRERDPGPTSALPSLDEGANKIVSQLGPLATVGEFVTGELGGTGRDLEPGAFEGRVPGWITNTPGLFFLFDAAFDLHARVNKDPAYGAVGDVQWYASDPRFYRAFMGLSGLDSEMATLTRYFATSPLVTSEQGAAYGEGSPLGIVAHRTAARPVASQYTIDRARQQRDVEAEQRAYKRTTPK